MKVADTFGRKKDSVSFTIYYEAEQEGRWFQGLSKHLASAEMRLMRTYGKNPRVIDELITYDLPDVILVVNDEPKIVLEKTEEVPTGHNVGQRFARLVRAAELGVMVIYFLPFAAMKHGKYANPCWVNARLLGAMFRVWEIHKTPFIAVDWPHDKDYELLRNGTEDKVVRKLIDELLETSFDLDAASLIEQMKVEMERAMKQAIERNKGYEGPPGSVRIEPTGDYLHSIRGKFKDTDLPGHLDARNQTLIYRIGMTEENCRREDPYTGMQLIYDYQYCRHGRTKYDRHTNLILDFPEIRKEVWLARNPYESQKKRRLWYLVPDLLVFEDGVINPKHIVSQGEEPRKSLDEWARS